MNVRHAYVLAFALVCGIITYHDIKDCKQLPWPPRFIAAGIVFAILDLFSLVSEDLSSVMTLGVVIGYALNKGFVGTCDNNNETAIAQPQDNTAYDPGAIQQPGTVLA